MLTPWYDPECDYVFIFDEPCETLHEIFDLDIGQNVLHAVKQTGRINNINLIHYARPTQPKGNKWKAYSDDCLHQVKKLFV
jgi:hypothetical protein